MKDIKERYYPLIGLMAKNNISKKEFADALGITNVTLYHRLRGTRQFTQEEISKTKELFNMSPEEVDKIFLQ